jgi:hypothetical protein
MIKYCLCLDQKAKESIRKNRLKTIYNEKKKIFIHFGICTEGFG